MRVSIDTVFYKNELLRTSVHVLRTIELDALEIFKAVVDCGGVTRAAAQLHRVPLNVTTRLKQLEEGLGTKLFHRHSRKLLLSTDGKLLLTYAERPLRLSGEAEFAFNKILSFWARSSKFVALKDELCLRSPEFRKWWKAHEIRAQSSICGEPRCHIKIHL